jgi:hypothetical protein
MQPWSRPLRRALAEASSTLQTPRRCKGSEVAKRGYEGAVTTGQDQQAQAVGVFLTDALLQI